MPFRSLRGQRISCSFNGRAKLLVMTREFTAVIEKKGRWYVAWVEEIPGVNTQGKTLAEARRNLKEALQLILEQNRLLSKSSAGARREVVSVEV